jgi:predicted Rossmann fold flavoprotein
VEFFKDLGVGVVLEAGGKYFPSTHSGRTVLEALLKEVEKQNINLQKGKKVTSVTFDQNYFILKGDHFSHRAKTVVLCTGGLSYPRTGSDGRGYSVAQALGHTLVPTIPALTPLETSDPVWKSLSGLTIPVSLSLWVNHKKQVSYEGSFLFTHFGFSGPAVLNISRHWIRVRELENVKLTAHFLPIFKEEDWRHLLIESARVHPTRSIKKELALKMPDRFIEVLCQKSEVNSAGLLGQLKKEDRERLIRAICASDLSITQALGYHKAEVTAGGVNLEEVDPHTLESKKQPGLFFAGEILDVDGRIGGFNFQWAWASGQVAGLAAARKFRT